MSIAISCDLKQRVAQVLHKFVKLRNYLGDQGISAARN